MVKEVEIRIWSSKQNSDETKWNYDSKNVPLLETDSLSMFMQKVGAKKYLYAWYDVLASKCDIENFLEVVFNDDFYIEAQDFYKQVNTYFLDVDDDDFGHADNQGVLNRNLAHKILDRARVRISKTFSDESGISYINPTGKMNTTSDIMLNFNMNIHSRLNLNLGSAVVIHVIHADTIDDNKDISIIPYLRRNELPVMSKDSLDKYVDVKIPEENTSFIDAVNIFFKKKKNSSARKSFVDLDEIFKFLPMKTNIAFIYRADGVKNMRINNNYEIGKTVDWMQNELFFNPDRLKRDRLFMYIEFTRESFVEVILHQSGMINLRYSKRMRNVKHSGDLKNLLRIIDQVSSSLRLFSDVVFKFDSTADSLFNNHRINIKTFKTYHTIKIDQQTPTLPTDLKNLREKLGSRWPFLLVPTEKQTKGKQRADFIYRANENSADIKLEMYLAMQVMSKNDFMESYGLNSEDAQSYFDQKSDTKNFNKVLKKNNHKFVQLDIHVNTDKLVYEMNALNLYGIKSHEVLLKHLILALTTTYARDNNSRIEPPPKAVQSFEDFQLEDGSGGESQSDSDDELEDIDYMLGGNASLSKKCTSEVKENFEDLKRLDHELFASREDAIVTKERGYASNCNFKPIGLTEEQFKAQVKHDEDVGEKSFTYFVKTGSSVDKCQSNYYICPRYWCPNSRIAVASEKTRCPGYDNGERPVQHLCETVNPYFLKPKAHKEGLELPCCGIKAKTKVEAKSCEIDSNENEKSDNSQILLNKLTSKISVKLLKIFDSEGLSTPPDDISDEVKISKTMGISESILNLVDKTYGPGEHVRMKHGYYLRAFYDPDMTLEKTRKGFQSFLVQNKDFMKSFNLSDEELKSNQEAIDMMFMVYNSYTNFMKYVRSKNPKSFQEMIDLTEFTEFNPTNLGILFIRDDPQGLTVDVEKSVLSSNKSEYGGVVLIEGSPQPIFDSNGKVAQIKIPVISDILSEHKVLDTMEFARNKFKLESSDDGLKLVVDLNFKVCGCLFEKIYIPFDDYHELGETREPHVFNFSLKLDKSHLDKAGKLYAEHGVEFELTDKGIYFPNQDMIYEYESLDDNMMPRFGFTWDSIAPVKKIDTICSLVGEKGNDDLLNDIYYLRHYLNPMLDSDKKQVLSSKYNVSKDLAECILRVKDVQALLEESKRADLSKHASRYISFRENGPSVREIMENTKKSFLKTFQTNMDDHMRHINNTPIVVKLKKTKNKDRFINVSEKDLKMVQLGYGDYSLVTLELPINEVIRFLWNEVLQYPGTSPTISKLRKTFKRPQQAEVSDRSFSKLDVLDVSKYFKLNAIMQNESGIINIINDDKKNNKFLRFHAKNEGGSWSYWLILEKKAGDETKVKAIFEVTKAEQVEAEKAAQKLQKKEDKTEKKLQKQKDEAEKKLQKQKEKAEKKLQKQLDKVAKKSS